ncbi:MAG: flagellar motor protein MotB [Acidocella sp. 20-57-95]|nr:MAG: flagellar motor protein MotB [Acidocella sp. 20-57-95]OYV61951.1 MAG: flagellar motor protein MotB [Acidocella sp. 21-58-7]HQT63403.1 peptidoglycan-binding protein [Acidocella sp.]HQU04031.1 peptidoglycan-binding protein [Acidocella sp.]
MARRRNGNNGLEAWPGYVDALSTLLMVIIFVLLVFVLAEAFLSSALTGSDNTINQLRSQISALSSALSLQTTKDASLQQELAALNGQLASLKSDNAALTAQLGTASAAQTAQSAQIQSLTRQLSDAQAQAQSAGARIAALQGQLAGQAQNTADAGPSLQDQLTETKQKLAAQTQTSQAALNEVDLLNQQLAALRLQMAVLAQALDAAQEADKKDNVQIVNLGKQLNEALARKVEELQQYRSEFFGTLRSVLANEPNIKIVGDRFVFESDVLFPVDQATLTPAGQAEIADVAKAIMKIAGKIPPNINWVLSVDGYADAQPITGGPYNSNFDLSTARSLAVLHLLVKDGVPEDRLAATGFGSANPIATGTTSQDYAQNRRIEFRLTSR